MNSKLPEFIYKGSNIPEILRLYENELRKNNDFQSIAHAGAIKQYHDIMVDKKFLALTRKTFDNLYSILESDPDLLFRIEGRRKSLISAEEKICKLLSENRSLDLFRDTFAFRIILFDQITPPEELIYKCYSVMNRIIEFFVSRNCSLCEEDPVVGTMDKNSPEFSKLIVPAKSGISDFYRYGVKDYILHPKKNGYQSLHCVLRSSSGYCFEIQVRTFDMHVCAVDGSAEHTAFKNKRDRIEIDPCKIHIPGYGISDNGKIFDFVGLQTPLSIIYRHKTF